ncbi:MAG: PfkB family carbohydrate kinase, partial [Dehalococcoidia bacterium]
HLAESCTIAGGGAGIAFHQLARSPGEVHLFTATGSDEAGHAVERALSRIPAEIHIARRDLPHTRDLAVITPDGERTIFVIGEPLHPRLRDDLPWEVLETCDAVYFTGQDPETLIEARKARVLVVTSRRKQALDASGVRADVVVGSTKDKREFSVLSDYTPSPAALVMTEGERGGYIETRDGVVRFPAPVVPDRTVAAYGAGDTFAAALTWYLARGFPLLEACTRAGRHGGAVLRGINPLEWQMELE